MSKSAHVPGGTVTSIQGRATVIPAGEGAPRVLKVGDNIGAGDSVITANGTNLVVTDTRGNPWTPRDLILALAEVNASPTPAGKSSKTVTVKAKTAAVNKAVLAAEDADKAIQGVDQGDADQAPAAGVTGGSGGAMTPGLRVDRVIEVVTPQEFVYGTSAAGEQGEQPFDNAVIDATVAEALSLLLATDDVYTTPVGKVVGLGLMSNDTVDPAAGVQVVAINGEPILPGTQVILAHGIVQMSSTGALTFVPTPGYLGDESFTYTLQDSAGQTSQATVTVTMTPPSAVPVANPDLVVIAEDAPPLTVSVMGNDEAGNDAPIQIIQIGDQIVAAGSVVRLDHASVTVNADGTLTIDPDQNFNGSISFAYTVSDQAGRTAKSTVSVQVTPTDDPIVVGDPKDPSFDPSAGGYTANTSEDQPVSGKVTATDADGDTLTFGKGSDPAHGSVTVNPDGTWTYAPAPNYNGSDSFTVVVSDGKGGSTAVTVVIGVAPQPDTAIVGAEGKTGSVTEDTAAILTTGGKLSVNDPDAGEAVFNAGSSTGAYGTFTVDANGNWTYSADNSNPTIQALGNGQTLTETFPVTTADGTTTSVTVTINGFNDAAVVSSSSQLTGSVTEDSNVSGGQISTGGKINVTDTDAGQATIQAGSSTGAYGTFTVDANGNWTYSADNSNPAIQALANGQTLTETFPVRTSDGTTTSVTVTINGANDSAVISSSSQ
ncbi:MAG: VCBS domain-containing protein, partial [Aquabacterium sp.]